MSPVDPTNSAIGRHCTIIVGASSGIGAEIAKILLRNGERVVLIARRSKKLEELASSFEKEQYWTFSCDISVPQEVNSCVEQIRSRNWIPGKIYLNAGIGEGDFPQFEVERQRHVFDVNYFGLLQWVEAFLPDMIQAGTGKVITTSSLMSYFSVASTSTAYGASKAALTNAIDTLRAQHEVDGIQFTCVHPGPIDTRMLVTDRPMPFTWSAERAASKIINGVNKGRTEIDFPWQYAWLVQSLVSLPKRLSQIIFRRKK